jgi:flavin reductase (DIM6/NTAB) family NADH-FMN oxidoreductase RutF
MRRDASDASADGARASAYEASGDPPMSEPHLTFDFSTLGPGERYKLLIGTVVPRPIALVTTVDPQGMVNAAPYSFFNVLSSDPAIVALGVENRSDATFKDTAHNVRLTEEFTVNIVSDAVVAAMNVCAVPFHPSIDELVEAGLTPVEGVQVRCPFIREAPAALECRRYITLEISRSREIILGKVVAAHLRPDVVDRDRFYVDPHALDAVGRMGGHGYARTRDYFDLPTMTVEQWTERQRDLFPTRMQAQSNRAA